MDNEQFLETIESFDSEESALFNRIVAVYRSGNNAAKRLMSNLLNMYPTTYQIQKTLNKAEKLIEYGIDYA